MDFILLLNSDCIRKIGEELWGKDLLSLYSSCSALREPLVDRMGEWKRVEVFVRKIRTNFSHTYRSDMERVGLLRFAQGLFKNFEEKKSLLEAFSKCPPKWKNAYKKEFLTKYTTQYLTTYELTTYSVIHELVLPYADECSLRP